jgi:repressor LexA
MPTKQTTTSQLTPRQLQLLKAIALSQASRCCSPTISELAETLSISRSTVFEHIAELRKKSLLSACRGKARSLQPTLEAQGLLERIGSCGTNLPAPYADAIPLAGTVAAGSPIEAVEDKDTLSFTHQFGPADELFALRVKGNSMIEDGICDGDYVICRKTDVADNGQLVVAIVDDENATLKRFYKERNVIRLQPANGDFKPIYSAHCRIEAIVVGLVRKL